MWLSKNKAGVDEPPPPPKQPDNASKANGSEAFLSFDKLPTPCGLNDLVLNLILSKKNMAPMRCSRGRYAKSSCGSKINRKSML